MTTTTTPLAGKTALITGGSRGIGAATAVLLAEQGASVAITHSSSPDAAEQVVKQIEAAGGRALSIVSDAADEQANRAAVQQTVDAFGGLDLLVLNAGVIGGGPLASLTIEEYDRVMAINVRAPLTTVLAAAEHLPEGGRVVVVGSINAEQALVPGMTVYGASKAAAAGLVRGLARDLAARKITVNAVQPGPVDTAMNPADGPFSALLAPRTALGRYATPQEIAASIAFLLSPSASYITGASLTVDGGFTI